MDKIPEKDLERIEKEVLLNKQEYLVSRVKPDDIIDYLIAKKLVGGFASQKFSLPTNTPDDKVRIILEELRRSRPGYLKEFCTILKESRTQDHIVFELEKGTSFYHSYDIDLISKATVVS